MSNTIPTKINLENKIVTKIKKFNSKFNTNFAKYFTLFFFHIFLPVDITITLITISSRVANINTNIEADLQKYTAIKKSLEKTDYNITEIQKNLTYVPITNIGKTIIFTELASIMSNQLNYSPINHISKTDINSIQTFAEKIPYSNFKLENEAVSCYSLTCLLFKGYTADINYQMNAKYQQMQVKNLYMLYNKEIMNKYYSEIQKNITEGKSIANIPNPLEFLN